MFRLIGFLIGSITSILIILLLIGMPNFHLADQQTDQQRFDEAIDKLKAKQHEFESVAGRLSEDVARVAETVETGFETLSNLETPIQSEFLPATPEPAMTIADPAVGELPLLAGTETNAMPGTLWFSFWNPFRSEIAANGFVSQLERVTGIDYRVVKVKTGVYEVAFAYNDDGERRDKLSQISAATGLELPDT